LSEEPNYHPDNNDLNTNVIIHHNQRNVVFLFIINSLICTVLYEKPLLITKPTFLE